jgi:adenylate kinase family enzyme
VKAVINLECSGPVVRERIASNVGGDREARVDDDPAAVERKLTLFHERTLPLIDHYRKRKARIVSVEVTATSTPETIWQDLQAMG